MKTILALVAAFIVAALLFVTFQPRDTYDPVAAAAAERAIARAEALEPLRTALDAGWSVLPFVAVVGLLVLVGRWAWLRLRLVRVDGAPVDLARLDDLTPAVLATYGQARVLDAQRPNVPHSLTYSPRWSNRQEGGALALEEGEVHTAALAAPSFAELLSNGTIAPGAPLVLGWSAEGAVTGGFRALLSTGLGGLQGSGKTTTAAALLSQAALSGGRLLVVDPHAGDPDSLATRIAPLAPAFLAEPASEGRAIIDVLRQARAELERRMHGSPDRWPLIVCVDEWTSLLRGELAEQLPAFIADLTQGGRKYGCYAFLLAQRWASSDVGGGGVRNTLAAAYVHRMRPEEARYLTGLRASQLPADVLQLASGESYLLDTSGALTKVRTPLITPSDVASVGQRLAALEGKGQAMGRRAEDSAESTPSASQRLTPEQARIMGLFVGGADVGAIVKELYGVEGGRPYNRRVAEVQAVIRQALEYAEGE
jgi:hypothetical protein